MQNWHTVLVQDLSKNFEFKSNTQCPISFLNITPSNFKAVTVAKGNLKRQLKF